MISLASFSALSRSLAIGASARIARWRVATRFVGTGGAWLTSSPGRKAKLYECSKLGSRNDGVSVYNRVNPISHDLFTYREIPRQKCFRGKMSQEFVARVVSKRFRVTHVLADHLDRFVTAMIAHLEQVCALPPRLRQEPGA